jgi:hypothetical protein
MWPCSLNVFLCPLQAEQDSDGSAQSTADMTAFVSFDLPLSSYIYLGYIKGCTFGCAFLIYLLSLIFCFRPPLAGAKSPSSDGEFLLLFVVH